MIQDIYPHIYHNEYKNQLPQDDSYVIFFDGRSVLIRLNGGEITFPTVGELRSLHEFDPDKFIYAFSVDETSYFLIKELPLKPDGYQMEDISVFRTAVPSHLAFAGITAFSLYSWYANHIYCGRCGSEMRHSEKERMLECTACSHTEYPKISPAIIVAVTHGNRLLLSKYANREYTNYALLAGFAEIGESIEETIKREVMEEVGLKVKNPVYYKSQPWGFTDTLLMGFFVELDGDDTIVLDKEELAEAVWLERENIPPGNTISLTGEMIEYFRNGNEGIDPCI